MPWVNPATRSTGYLWTAANTNELVNNFLFLAEVAYTEVTSDITVTATTVGTANQIIAAGSLTYEAVPHLITFHCARYTAPAQQTWHLLRDGSTVLGTVGNTQASDAEPGLTFMRRLTPTAAAHNYNIASYLGGAGTGTYKAGTGGTAGDGSTYLPMWIRVERLPT